MKKIFGISSLVISALSLVLMLFTYYKDLDKKELTLIKDYQDIYISYPNQKIDFFDSLGESEFLTLMPSKIKMEIPPFKSENISISEWTIKNTGHSTIKNEKSKSPIKIELPKESKIYFALLEDSYIIGKPLELIVDTVSNSVIIDEFLLNVDDELWITVVHEFSNAKSNYLNPIFTFKGEGITGFKDEGEWDPLNLNKYINVSVYLYGAQIIVFLFISTFLFSVGSFRLIVFKFSNKRKLIELIFVFFISISLGEISTYLIFGESLSLEITSILSIIGIIYYIRLYLFLKSN